jgi:hypothetical protein
MVVNTRSVRDPYDSEKIRETFIALIDLIADERTSKHGVFSLSGLRDIIVKPHVLIALSTISKAIEALEQLQCLGP